MATWTVEINFNLGSGWEDITNYVLTDSFTRKRTIHNDLKPTINTCKFLIKSTSTLANKFVSGTTDIDVRITKDAADYFTGYIRENNFSLKFNQQLKPVSVECVDGSWRLKNKITETFAWNDYKISDSGDTTNSILYQLLTRAGFGDSQITPTNVLNVIDYYIHDATNSKNRSTYEENITQLLLEYGYVYNFDESGYFTIYNIFPSSTSNSNNFNNLNIYGEVSITDKTRKYEQVEVNWRPKKTASNVVIFSDTTNGNNDAKCNIEIGANEYYPHVDGDVTHANYKYEDRDIVYTSGQSLKYSQDGSDISVTTETYYPKTAIITFYNTDGISSNTLTLFDIVGDVVYLGDEYTTIDTDVALTEKIKTFDTEYIDNSTDAQALVNGFMLHYKYGVTKYKFKSTIEYNLGAFATLGDSLTLGFSQNVVITSIEDRAKDNFITYFCEGTDDYVSRSITQIIVNNQPPPTPETIDLIAPSDENLVGYWTLNKTPNDMSGNGYHGILTGGAGGYESFVAGFGFHFDGSLSSLEIPNRTDFNFGTGDFGIALRVHIDDTIIANETFFLHTATGIIKIRTQVDGTLKGFVGLAGDYTQLFSDAGAIVSGIDYFIVLTRINGVAYMYLDGVLIDSGVAANNTDSTSDIHIGSSGASEYTDGKLGQVRIYNTGLTQANVTWLYFNPAGTQTVSIIPKDPGTANLVGYWPLNDTADDLSGNGLHGTLTPGAGGYEEGIAGKVFHFDGAASQIDIPNHTSFNFGTGDFSVSVFIKGDSIPGAPEYFFSKRGAAAYTGWWIQRNVDLTIDAYVGEDPTTLHVVSGTTITTNGQWYYIVFMRINGVLRLYIDAVLEGTNADGSYNVDDSLLNLTLGYNDQGNNYHFNGLLCHARLYNKALDQAEMDFLHKNPTGAVAVTAKPVVADNENLIGYWPLNGTLRDFSGNNKHGTFNADGGNYEDSQVGMAYHFNEVTNDSIQLPTNLGTLTAFTICAWVYLDTISPTKNYARIIELRQASDDDRILIYFNHGGANDKFVFNCIEGGGNNIASTNVDAEASKWYHIIGSYDGETVRLYLDLILQDTVASETGATWTPDENAIGSPGNASTANNLDGLIAQVRLYDSVLTAAEREYLFLNPTTGAGPIPKDPGTLKLVGYWPCDETSDPVIIVSDTSGQGNHLDTVTESVSFVDGHVFNALESVTGAGKVERSHDISTSLSDALATGDFSITGWVYFATEDDFELLISFGVDGGAYAKRVYIQHANDDASNPGITIASYDGVGYRFTSLEGANAAGVLEYDKWHHIVMTYDRTDASLKLYIDGVYRGQNSYGALHTFTDCQIIGFLTGTGIGDKIDEPRVYSKVLDYEEQLYLYNNPGGTPHGLVTKNNIAVGEIDATHLLFGGYKSLITNTELWDDGNGELFTLGFDLISDGGRSPEEKLVHKEPAILRTSDEVEYNNPRAKQWYGLEDDPYTDTIGIYDTATNLVPYPEDVTEWDHTACTSEILEETFDGVPWQRVTCDDASAAAIQDLFDFVGDPCSVRCVVRKGPDQTGVCIVKVQDQTIAAGGAGGCYATINFAAGTVSFSAFGTGITIEEVDVDWILANEIVSISFIANGLSTGEADTFVFLQPDRTEAAGRYADFCMIQVEDNPYPTPYCFDTRPAGKLEYRKNLKDEGSIECWVRPRFTYDDSGFHTIWSWYKDTTHYFKLHYRPAADEFTVQMRWGGTTQTLDQATNYTNSTLWDWIHIKVVWDFSANTGKLIVNDATRDAAWSGAPDTYDGSAWKFFIGSSDGSLNLFDGEITDLVIHSTEDETTTHYTNNKPWKGRYDVPNYDQSVIMTRKALKLTRAELSIIDKKNRTIDVGSQGILARDRVGNVIHDIPDGMILTGMNYGGHLYFQESPAGNFDIDSLGATDTATDLALAYGTLINADLTDFLPKGLTNPSGLILIISSAIYGASGKFDADTFGQVGFEHGVIYNTSASSINQMSHFHTMNNQYSGDLSFSKLQTQVFAPVTWNAGIPYLTWRMYGGISDMTVNNLQYALSVNVIIQGFLV